MERGLEEKDGKGDKGERTRTGGITERLPCHNRAGYSSVATMVLQYRRGGNRPITRRLLICWAQTAAVLPPMRNPLVYTASIYTSNSRSRIRSPLDSRWDIRSAMAFFIPSHALIRLASPSSSPSSCPDAHYLLAAWTKHFLIGFRRRGDACPALFWKQPAFTSSIIY